MVSRTHTYKKIVQIKNMFYGDVVSKENMFKHDTSKIIKLLKNLIRKNYDLATIISSLRQVYFAKKY
jgi:hypothetical protein